MIWRGTGASRRARSLAGWELGGISAALVIATVAFSLAAPAFYSPYNIDAVARNLAILVVVALGQMVVLAVGQFNLCLTAIGASAGLVTAWLMQDVGIPWVIAVGVGLLLGLGAGALQGLVIVVSGINPFVVSLALASIFFGLLLGVTQGTPFGLLDETFVSIGHGNFLGVPLVVMCALGLSALVGVLFTQTVLGRQLLAAGASKRAAEMSGLRVGRLVVVAHTVSGGLAGAAAILLVATLGAAQASLGASWLLPSFAAPVLGGTLLAGGRASVIGVIFGAALLVVLANGLVLVGVSDYWNQTFLGVLLLGALLLDRWRRRVLLGR